MLWRDLTIYQSLLMNGGWLDLSYYGKANINSSSTQFATFLSYLYANGMKTVALISEILHDFSSLISNGRDYYRSY